jgi:hypothetical protein
MTNAWLMLQRNLLYTPSPEPSGAWSWLVAVARWWPRRSALTAPDVATLPPLTASNSRACTTHTKTLIERIPSALTVERDLGKRRSAQRLPALS